MDTKAESKPGAASRYRAGIDDFYWLAVPLWELQEEAELRGADCTSANSFDLQKCSEYSVRSILCGCVLEFDSVVNSAAQYFLDHV